VRVRRPADSQIIIGVVTVVILVAVFWGLFGFLLR
jgi:hypothetical protein